MIGGLLFNPRLGSVTTGSVSASMKSLFPMRTLIFLDLTILNSPTSRLICFSTLILLFSVRGEISRVLWFFFFFWGVFLVELFGIKLIEMMIGIVEEEEKKRMEVMAWGADKWKGIKGRMEVPKNNNEKAAKIVNLRVSPRMIQQPR